MDIRCRVPSDLVNMEKPLLVHSMPKTGTSTLRKVLEIMGLTICGHMPEVYNISLNGLWEAGKATPHDVHAFRKSVSNTGCSVHGDFPMGHCPMTDVDSRRGTSGYGLGLKFAAFPEARVVHITRDRSSWVRSLLRWERTHPGTYRNMTHDPYMALSDYDGCHREVLLLQVLYPDRVLVMDLESLNLTKVADFVGWPCQLPAAVQHIHENQAVPG